MLFQKFTRQKLNRLGVTQLRTDLCIGHTVSFSQGRRYLVIRAVTQIDQHFTEKLTVSAFSLLGQCMFNLLFCDDALGQEQLPQLHFISYCYFCHDYILRVIGLSLQLCKTPDSFSQFRIAVEFLFQSGKLEYLGAVIIETGQS